MSAVEVTADEMHVELTRDDVTLSATTTAVLAELDGVAIRVSEAHDHCDWVHCSDEHQDLVEDRDKILDELTRWHDREGHIGGLRLCYEQPCRAIREAADL